MARVVLSPNASVRIVDEWLDPMSPQVLPSHLEPTAGTGDGPPGPVGCQQVGGGRLERPVPQDLLGGTEEVGVDAPAVAVLVEHVPFTGLHEGPGMGDGGVGGGPP